MNVQMQQNSLLNNPPMHLPDMPTNLGGMHTPGGIDPALQNQIIHTPPPPPPPMHSGGMGMGGMGGMP